MGGATPRELWRLNEAYEGMLVQRETFGNGTTSAYTYHPERHWLETIATTRQSETLQALAYTHYDNGQLFQRTDSTNPAEIKLQTHHYDNLGRLTKIERPGLVDLNYAYDAIGNITQRGIGRTNRYRTDRPHLLEGILRPLDFTVPSTRYEYDAAGRISERSGQDVPGGKQTFEYTPFDLPRSITTGTTTTSAKTTLFEYSADQERLVRRDDTGTRHFVPDLYQRLIDASGNTIEERYQLHAGARPLGEIIRTTSGEQTLYFHTDRLGSVDTLSNDTGESFRQDFDAFGEPIDPPNTELTRYGFTAHQHDQDLGLVDMRGRLYDPLAATFATPDPIMQAPFWSQGLNRYSYVFNDPVNLTDPSGFSATGSDFATGMGIWSGGVVGLAASGGLGLNGFGLAAAANLGTSAGGGLAGTGTASSGPADVATPSARAPTSNTGGGSMQAVGQNGPLKAVTPGDLAGAPVAKGQNAHGGSRFAQERTCPENGCLDHRLENGEEIALLPVEVLVYVVVRVGDAAAAAWQWFRGPPPPAPKAAPAPAPAAGREPYRPHPIDPKTLPRPPGMNNSKFGELIGWTQGKVLAENMTKTQELIAHLPQRLPALREAGVTKAMAQRWADFYKAEAARWPQNPNALPRSKLMQALADLL